MIFRQLFDASSSTYTYLLADEESHEALLIDPVFEQASRDLALLDELGLQLLHQLRPRRTADGVHGGCIADPRLRAQRFSTR